MARTVKNYAQANNTITTNPNTATQTSSQANITAAQSQIQDARIHLMNSQTATQASNAPVGQISVAEIEALLAGKTLKEQVNDFRRNTYKLYRDPNLSIDDVERNGKIAEHLDSILANDTSSFARRSRRNIKRTQSFLEKKILRKELNTLNKEITDLLNSDQAITAEDLEKIVQQKEKLQKLLDKHANNFLLEKLAKNIDKKLDKLFDKFLTPLRPKMQNLTDKLSKIIKSGTSISFDEHVKLQDEYDELLLKFGSLEHSEIKNFKDSADKKFSQISIENLGPIIQPGPIIKPGPIIDPAQKLNDLALTLIDDAINTYKGIFDRPMKQPIFDNTHISDSDKKAMRESSLILKEFLNPLDTSLQDFDIDNDGKINNQDALAVINEIAKNSQDDKFDVNNDGSITVLDALQIINKSKQTNQMDKDSLYPKKNINNLIKLTKTFHTLLKVGQYIYIPEAKSFFAGIADGLQNLKKEILDPNSTISFDKTKNPNNNTAALSQPGQALKTSGINLVTATEVDNLGGINESTEYAFSSFKIDFYQSQKTDLQSLLDDPSNLSRTHIRTINKEIRKVNTAVRFWNRRNDSWQEKSFSEDRLQVGDNAFSAF